MKALSTIAKGAGSRITDRRRVIVKSPEEWAALWAAHAGPESEPPPVNFASALVAGVFAGPHATSGHAIEIVGAVEEEGGTRLIVEERRSNPSRAGSDADGTIPVPNVADSAILAPFHIVTMPRVDGEIRWTDGSRTRPEAPADPSARIVRAAHSRRTSTGLRPRTAAVMSYLAGPVSGLIMLVAEPAQPFVRFHAWQSVIALGTLGVAIALCYALAVASLFFTANGLAVMVRVATAVWIGLLVLWVVCLWQAWRGYAWKLPLAGRWAERLTTRAASAASFQQPAASSKGGASSL